MTPREVLEVGFAYLGEHGIGVANIARGPLYLRMSARQRELFAFASSIDREYFGNCVTVILDNGGADLKELETSGTLHPIESIEIIRVADVGSSGYATGTRVRLIRADDTRELPPRAVLRDMVLRGVGTDLSSVGSVELFYTRRPWSIGMDGKGPTGAEIEIELTEPHHVLLSLDIAKYVLGRDPQLISSPAMQHLAALEAQELALFESHIRNSYRALEARFG